MSKIIGIATIVQCVAKVVEKIIDNKKNNNQGDKKVKRRAVKKEQKNNNCNQDAENAS